MSNADLTMAQLSLTDLRFADFSGADFSYATLNGALLNGVNFFEANLKQTDLSGANLKSGVLGKFLFGKSVLSDPNFADSGASQAVWFRAPKRDEGDAVPKSMKPNITAVQIRSACQKPKAEAPKLPEGMKWHGRVCERYRHELLRQQ